MSNYTTDDNGIPLKQCSEGDNCLHPMGCWQPATLEFFSPRNNRPSALQSRCKVCMREYDREWKLKNKEKIASRRRKERQAAWKRLKEDPEKYAEHLQKQREYRENRKADFITYRREYYQANREKIRENQQQYYQEHREEILKRIRQWRITQKDSVRAQRKKHYQKNRTIIAARMKRWQQANPEKVAAAKARREARKRQFPVAFTFEQWQSCLEYHHYCCAVCGNQLRDLFGDVKPHADHWIPLSYEGADNPGTVATNMICLCSDCNFSKRATMPDVWLIEQYGKRKANEILTRVNTYFEWITSQPNTG